jgi:hypothetical protein
MFMRALLHCHNHCLLRSCALSRRLSCRFLCNADKFAWDDADSPYGLVGKDVLLSHLTTLGRVQQVPQPGGGVRVIATGL